MSEQEHGVDDAPWRSLPPQIGELVRPHVADLSDEVIAAIRERVPAYSRPLRGRFGTGIRGGVAEALSQFVDLVADPTRDRSAGDAIYRGLGRGEYRERRSLDALLAAYRVGARVSWRRVSQIAIDAGTDRDTLALLAEAVFAYIDELSALSAEGYAQAQSQDAGEAERRRRRLALLLLDAGADQAAIEGAAADADWRPPDRIAALVWKGEARGLRSRLPGGSLVIEERSGDAASIALIPDPDAPGLLAGLRRAASPSEMALGPAVDLAQAAESAARARTTLRLVEAGEVEAGPLAVADDHLAELIAHADERLLGDLAASRLAALDEETPASRARLLATLRAWLDHQGEVAAVASELHVHPQTVRYRVARLRERLGDSLDDPGARFELALALKGTVRTSQ